MSKNNGNSALPRRFCTSAKPRSPSRHLWFAEAWSENEWFRQINRFFYAMMFDSLFGGFIQIIKSQ